MKHDPFVIERTYSAPVAKVWEAITNKNQMKIWYFDIDAFKPEVGFKFSFEGKSDDKTYVHLCKITDVIRDKRLTYSWCYKGYQGISFVTFELFPAENGTRLKLTHEGLESFPAQKDFAKESFAMGWNHIIGKSLREFVEK
ncbi:MAG: SRPBCC domain-containing protein [Ginsengibacter sp.]